MTTDGTTRVTRRLLFRASSALGALALLPTPRPAAAQTATRHGLAGVHLHDTPDAVARAIGVSEQATIVHGNGSPEWRYPGRLVQFLTEPSGPEVMNVVLLSSEAGSTDRGVRVGSSLSGVLERYGASVIQNDQSSLTVPLDASTRLNFEIGRDATVSAISLRRLDCATCGPIVAGPRAEKP